MPQAGVGGQHRGALGPARHLLAEAPFSLGSAAVATSRRSARRDATGSDGGVATLPAPFSARAEVGEEYSRAVERTLAVRRRWVAHHWQIVWFR